MKTLGKSVPKKQGHSADAKKLRLSAVAVACALAFSNSAYAQADGSVVVSNSNLLTDGTSQTVGASGFDLTLLSSQINAAQLTSQVLANALTASFRSGSDTALTISGNSVSASAGSNQASNAVSLGLLGAGTNPFAIAAANSQLRAASTTSASVTDQTIEARSKDTERAPITISSNSISASADLNTANTSVSGVINTAFNSSQGVSGQLNEVDTPANVSANIALVNAQTASNASGNSGSRAAVTNANVIVSANGASLDQTNTLSDPVTLANNTVSAGFAANTATTVYSANPGSAAFKGGVIVANVQSDLESSSDSGAATALIQGTAITANVRQPGVQSNVMGSALTISGNQLAASSNGNRAGSLDASGRVLAGNAIVIDSASSVASDLDTSSLTVTSLQQSSGTRYASAIEGTTVRALADSIGSAGSVTLRDNALSASAAANVAGNLASISSDSISTNTVVSNIQSAGQTAVSSAVAGSSMTAQVSSLDVDSSGTLTMSGNALSAGADGNIAANTLVQRASSIIGRTESINDQLIGSSSIRAELSDSNVNATVDAPSATSMTLSNSRNSLAAVANGNTSTGSISLQATQIGSQAQASNSANLSTQNALDLQLAASAQGQIGSTVSGNASDTRLSLTDNSISSAAVGNRASQLTNISATSFVGAQTSVNSNQTVSGSISSTTNALTNLTVSTGSSVSASSLTATGNMAASQAIGNTSLNSLALSASSASGSGSALSVGNNQYAEGDVQAQTTAASRINAIGAIDSSTITLSNNQITATAMSQSTFNELQISTSSLSELPASISNIQNQSNGNVSASVTAAAGAGLSRDRLFGVTTDSALSSPITVSGNRAGASSMQNDATNVLRANSTSLSSGSGLAALSVDNQQSSSGGSSASVSSGMLGLQANSLDSGNAVVSDNRMTASAGVNTATNAVIVNATSTLNAISAVNSNQFASGAVDSSVGSDSKTTYLGVIAPLNAGIALNALNATVSGNMMMAQGTANAATNILNATSANPIGNASAFAPVATYALNSLQTSNGPISTRVTNAQVGIVGASVDGSALTISGNTIAALSTANTATNQLTLSVMPGSAMQASSSLSNIQTSTSAVSAQVSGVTLIAGAGAPTLPGSSRTATLSGNAIAAQATGNTAINQLIGR